MMPKTVCWAVTMALLTALSPAVADDMGIEKDEIARRVFPPRLVIRHQEQIGLTESQRQQFVAEMQRSQADLLPLQLDLSRAGEELARVLEEPVVDEERALELTGRMLELEGRIKHRHMTLLVRVKNLLTPEQQAELRLIRRRLRTKP